MKRIFYLLVLLFVHHSFLGQVEVKGRVFDGLTKDPIADVAIFSNLGLEDNFKTDSLGYFTLRLKRLPAEVAFVRVGYYDEKFMLIENEIMLVYLEPSSWLSELEIRSSNVELFAGTFERFIWDYALLGRYTVVCDYGNSLADARLICLNDKGDTLGTVKCPERPYELFTDCEGNAHFQGEWSTYQIIYSSKGLSLLEGVENVKIATHLKRCEDKVDLLYYYAKKSGGRGRFAKGRWIKERPNHDVAFFIGDKLELNPDPFWTIRDEFAYNLKRNEMAFGEYWSRNDSTSFSFQHILNSNSEFFYRIMLKEIYTPLVAIDDTLFIFDHPNGKIEKFSKIGQHIGSVPIRYPFTRDFKRQLLFDEINKSVYLVFEKKNVTYLCELDPHRGIIINQFPLEYNFAYQIDSRDGWVYYLHRHPDRKDARLLSRMKIPRKPN